MEDNTDRFEFDVFLSYNQADKLRVHRLAERLKKKGLRVWLDEWSIQPGDLISLKVGEGLKRSRVLLLCISPAALASGWVALELSTAVRRDPANADRRFVPLLLSDCDLPDTLLIYKYVDYRDESEVAFAEVLAACSGSTSRDHQPSVESLHVLPTDVSPFFTGTSMPVNHRSYIERKFDSKFATWLDDPKKPCIAINAESGTGKTSLMNRAGQFLGSAWTVVFINVSNLRADKVENCIDRFLDNFRGAFGNLASLSELATRVHEKPVLVRIDEIPVMAGPGAKVLLPDLMGRVREAGGKLRVVVTLITEIEPILKERGVDRDEDLELWHTITLERFDESEAKELFALLPAAAKKVTDRLFGIIQRRSELIPRKLQFLADRLWDAHRDGADDARLADLISCAASYRP